MAVSIKYRFDEVMLRYVKDLQFKTTAFSGFEKKDVYEKIKLLISEARDVCEDVYQEAVEELGLTEEERKLDSAQITSLLEEKEELEERVKTLEDKADELNGTITALQDKLELYSENSEKLEQANEIIREARLESEKIITDGQEKAEQEILLGRAKARLEREEAEKELEHLQNNSLRLKEYLQGGQAIYKQMQEYAESLTLEDIDFGGQTDGEAQ